MNKFTSAFLMRSKRIEQPETSPTIATDRQAASPLAPSTQAWIDRGMQGVTRMHEDEASRAQVAARLS